MLKKILLSFVALLCLSLLATYVYFTNEIDRTLGGNTRQVDSRQFKRVQGSIAITNAHVLSDNGEVMKPHQTILIDDNTITAVGEFKSIPSQYHIIDGEGKFVIPGLVDSHVHIKKSKNDLLLYIANGVTHVGEMTGMDHQFDYIEQIELGDVGPGIYLASPKVTSQEGWYPSGRSMFEQRHQNFPTTDLAREAVRQYKNKGYKAIKLSSDISNEIYYAINDEAAKQNIPVIGHLPVGLTLEDLFASGQSQLSHIDSVIHNLMNQFGGLHSNNDEEFLKHVKTVSDKIASKLKQQNVTLASTLWLHKTLEQQSVALPYFFKQIPIEYQNPGWLEGSQLSKGCLPGKNSYEVQSQQKTDKQLALNFRKKYNQAIQILFTALIKHDVNIIAGTDSLGACGMIAGFSLHEELKTLNNYGMTNAQVLRSATDSAAEWMGIKAGKVKAGYHADLVILNKNPLENISHTRTIYGVINQGKYYNQTTLNNMLRKVKEANNMSRRVNIDRYL